MNTWTIIGLVLAAALMALGLAINGEPAHPSAIGGALTILGGSGAAVCITLWAVRAMRLDRHLIRTRRDSPRIDALIAELADCAAQADSRGVLTLTDRALSERQSLFAEGVEMLIRAEPPAVMSAKLGERAEREAAAAHAARRRTVAVFRIVPIVALTLALATMIWMLAAMGRPAQMGTMTPLLLALTVFGAFAAAAVSVELGDRFAAAQAEDELTRILVIQTLIAIRAGEKAERVAAILRGLTPPSPAADAIVEVRRAA